MVKIRSSEELQNAMEKCILNPEIIPVWGEKSFQMVRERFEVNLVNRQYLAHMGIGGAL